MILFLNQNLKKSKKKKKKKNQQRVNELMKLIRAEHK
jgi:hypothetical protein